MAGQELHNDLAADLAEMRPLLVRNFKPERTVTQVADDLFVAWMWTLGHQVGVILGGSTEREVLERLATGVSPLIATVAFDGTVRDYSLPWVRLDERPGGEAATRRLVEAVHARLFGFYDQIDFEAIARPRDQPDATAEETSDEVVAASVDILRRRDGDARIGRLGVRTNRLLSVLEGLGCEVRQGKGSEISIFRPGGRIWSLKHHKRNARHGWAEIRQILKRVGLSIEEWAAAVGARG